MVALVCFISLYTGVCIKELASEIPALRLAATNAWACTTFNRRLEEYGFWLNDSQAETVVQRHVFFGNMFLHQMHQILYTNALTASLNPVP